MSEAKTPKSRRTVDLSGQAIALLRQHRLNQNERRLHLGSAWTDHNLVFPSGVGTPWLSRDLYRSYRTVVDHSGITDPSSVVFHTLRHTAATHWIRAGVELHTIARRLGHASAAFTSDVYGHLLSGQQDQAATAMDHLLA